MSAAFAEISSYRKLNNSSSSSSSSFNHLNAKAFSLIASFECRIQQPESKRIACLLAMLFYPARLVDARYNQIQNYLGSALDILLRAMICKYVCETKELLGMCLRGKKIAPLWHKGC